MCADRAALRPSIQAGVRDGWSLYGPAHKQRYAEFKGGSCAAGQPLLEAYRELFSSPSFGRWVERVARVEVQG